MRTATTNCQFAIDVGNLGKFWDDRVASVENGLKADADEVELEEEEGNARPSRNTRSRPLTEAEDQMIDEDALDGPDAVAVETRKPVSEKKKKRTDQIPGTFPHTMQMVKPTRFPYVAQVGDIVVYCTQGHLNYLSKVELLGVYPLGKKAELPSTLKAEEFCIVDEVKYKLHPHRLTCLKLSQVNERNERTGRNFSIKFHDLDDCPDFIVLRHIYDNAISKPLNEGDEIEALIEGSWWTGSVTLKSAFSDEYPQSNWNLLHIRWDTGDKERMSPWDCQKKTPGRELSSSASLDEELELGQYVPTDEDWPGNKRPQLNMQAHCERLYAAIIKLSEFDNIAPFAYPVDLSEFTDYPAYVSYCIDLQTIAERLKNRYYRRLKAVQHDIRHVAIAAEQYNMPSSAVVETSRRLVEVLIRISRDSSCRDPEEMVRLYDTVFDLGMEEITAYREKDVLPVSTGTIKNKLPSDHSAAQKLDWKVETHRTLSTVFKLPYAEPFYDKDTADDKTIRTALMESGDLKSVLNELHLFNQPDAVIGKIRDIVDHCRETMQRDLKRRKYDDAAQLVKNVEQKMKAVVDEFNSAMESTERQDISARMNLSQRASEATAIQTRSRAAQPSSPGRTTTESVTGEMSASTVAESTGEMERRPHRPAAGRRMSIPYQVSGSDHLSDDNEVEEEQMEPRRVAGTRKRKRNRSDSDEEYVFGDYRSTALRRTRRSTTRVDESKDEGQDSVSLYGRNRRKRRLD